MDDVRVDFLFTLYTVGRMVKGHYKKENKDIMLSSAILHLLQVREYTLSELAKIMYSKLSALSEKLSEMEKTGLIKKAEKKDDEREQYISLTPKGKKEIKKILVMMKKHCMQFAKDISDKELEYVNPILKKIIS